MAEVAIPLLDPALRLVRGAIQTPRAVREEGIAGAPNALLNPGKYERSARVDALRQQHAEQINAVEALIDGSEGQDLKDLAPAFGAFARLGGMMAMDANGDPKLLEAALAPTAGKLQGAFASRFNASAPGAQEQLVNASVAMSPPTGEGLRAGAKSIGDIFRNRALTKYHEAGASLRGDQSKTEGSKQRFNEARAKYYDERDRSSGRGRGAGGGNDPRLTDLDRVDNYLFTGVSALNDSRNVTAEFPRQAAELQARVAERNRRAAVLGRPAVALVGNKPGEYQIVELDPNTEQGVPTGPDIGTGGFSLDGFGEIPEGAVPQESASGGWNLGGNQAPPPIQQPGGEELATMDLAPPAAQQPQQIQQPQNVIPPLPQEMTGALQQGTLRASDVIRYYMSQGYTQQQATEFARGINSASAGR